MNAKARPVISLRASEEEAELLRALTKRMRRDPAFKAQLARRLGTAKGQQPWINLGRFLTEEDAVAALVDALVVNLDPAEIWLFGSRARGDARPDSDFDLLVVFACQPDELPDDIRMRRAVLPLFLGVDLVPYSQVGFTADKDAAGTIPYEAVTTGRRLYARA